MAITDYPLTSKFNEIDNFHPIPHKGLDIALPLFTPVEALSDGFVASVSTNEILGNNIRLQTNDGKIIIYGHLAKFKVKIGDQVSKGDVIGLSGGVPGMQGAGRSNGAHLHLGVIENGITVNPQPYLFGVQQNDSSPFLFPVMLILLLFVLWKFKKVFAYLFVAMLVMTIIFIVS